MFVVASDNPEWCRKYLSRPEWSMEFTTDYYDRIGNLSQVFFDFTVLARSNHSVNNVIGTFSFWASFLAGGDVFQALDYPWQTRRLQMAIQIARANRTRYRNVKFPELHLPQNYFEILKQGVDGGH